MEASMALAIAHEPYGDLSPELTFLKRCNLRRLIPEVNQVDHQLIAVDRRMHGPKEHGPGEKETKNHGDIARGSTTNYFRDFYEVFLAIAKPQLRGRRIAKIANRQQQIGNSRSAR